MYFNKQRLNNVRLFFTVPKLIHLRIKSESVTLGADTKVIGPVSGSDMYKEKLDMHVFFMRRLCYDTTVPGSISVKRKKSGKIKLFIECYLMG